MAGLSRRRFLQSSAAAAAGAAVVGVPAASALAASGSAKAAAPVADAAQGASGASGASGSMMVWISDATSGDVSILVGDNEVAYHDPDLVARVARAAGKS